MPLWVKPSRLGSCVGITKVDSPEQELDEAIELRARHDPRVIIEAHAEGREVECSVIGNTEPETSLPGEIVPQGATGTTSSRSTRRAGWSSRSRRRSATTPSPASASSPPRSTARSTTAGSPAATSSSRLGRGPGQRDQHDPRLHHDQRLRQALRGERHPVPGALRPPGPARGRAPRASARTSSERPMAERSAIVVGAGVFGAAAADSLARRGWEVCGLRSVRAGQRAGQLWRPNPAAASRPRRLAEGRVVHALGPAGARPLG